MFQNLPILEKFCHHSESIKSNFSLCNKQIVFDRTKYTYCIFEICRNILSATKPIDTRPRNTGAGTPETLPNITHKKNELKNVQENIILGVNIDNGSNDNVHLIKVILMEKLNYHVPNGLSKLQH